MWKVNLEGFDNTGEGKCDNNGRIKDDLKVGIWSCLN